MIAYELQLDQDRRWALMEGSMHFERESALYKAMKKIVHHLEDLDVPFVVVGGMAMFLHGYRRFTEVVEFLVNSEGLRRVHETLEGRGYLPPFEGSKHLRDAENGVRFEFLTSGGYPGDGKPKPVAFPEPATACVTIDGIPCLPLPRLVELKLASGITNPGRLKNLAAVQEMVKVLQLRPDFAEELNPFVREKYRELWAAVQ